MHIIKIKTKITDLSFGQVRPGLGKRRPITIFRAARESLKQIIKKLLISVCLHQILDPFLAILDFQVQNQENWDKFKVKTFLRSLLFRDEN